MNIFYVTYSRLPTEKAHGLQIMKTCEALASAGAQVELVIPRRKNPLVTDPFEYYRVERNFLLTKIASIDILQWGIVGFVLSSAFFAEVARFIDRFWRADYIYSRDALVLIHYYFLGRPLVFEVHQPPTMFRLIVAKRAARVITISQALADAYIRQGVRKDRVIVAPDAVDIKAFTVFRSKAEARKELSIISGERIAVYTGHLFRRKGIDTLAEAAKISGIHTYFVGGTTEDVQAFRRRYTNIPTIHVVGYRPPSEIPLWLKAADVLVLPNSGKDDDSALYTSPMKLAEYLASGTPLIVSDVPALRGLRGSATYFEADNATSLAKALAGEWVRPVAPPYTWDERARTLLKSL